MKPPLRITDLRGAARLATHGVTGATEVVEGIHVAVLRTLGLASGTRSAGITGLVYRSVHGVTRVLGGGADLLLRQLEPALESLDHDDAGSPRRTQFLAALNGIMGDRMAADGNPLALDMSLRFDGRRLDPTLLPPAPGGKLLLMIHGLCMSDLNWSPQGEGVDHGAALAAERGYLPLHLRYNSGLPIAANGRQLAALLEPLVAAWPQPIEELSVLGHSMGGLVMRSACQHAAETGHAWPQRLRHIVFLGTPHLGAPLERAGHGLHTLLEATSYTAPLARIGGLRSAGITDLRHGRVSDSSDEQAVPLPDGVSCHAIAATTAARRGLLADRLVGDGLVPLNSALGCHRDPRRRLRFAPESRWIAYRTGHIELLRRPEVTKQLLRWLD
jgi:pimeloyl-ACP methyl ester carboxylesterase